MQSHVDSRRETASGLLRSSGTAGLRTPHRGPWLSATAPGCPWHAAGTDTELGACPCCRQLPPCKPPAAVPLPFPRLGQALAEQAPDFYEGSGFGEERKRKDWCWYTGLVWRGPGWVTDTLPAQQHPMVGHQLLSWGTVCTLCDSTCWLGRVWRARSDSFFSSRSQQKRPQFQMPKVSRGSGLSDQLAKGAPPANGCQIL